MQIIDLTVEELKICLSCYYIYYFSIRRRHTRCALVTGVQTCALPISTIVYDKLVGIDNGGSLAALPDIAAQLQRLFEGQPIGRGEALTHSAGPKAEDVEIGRASCRTRVYKYVVIMGVVVILN